MPEKIAEPGVYTISLDAYHGDCCGGPSISGSGLVKLERECPAKFWVDSYLNPQRVEEQKRKFDIGKAAHALLLEGLDAFKSRVRIAPQDFNARTKDGKAWCEEQVAAGFTVLAYDDWIAIKAMAGAVAAHPMASRAFSDGRPEMSLFWKDGMSGIWLKARPDWLPHTSRFCPNYKTSATAKPEDFARFAFNLGYHQGAALTIDGLKTVCGIEHPAYYFVVQEREPPYVVTICTLKDAAIEWGRILNRRALDLFARCLDEDRWPGYADDVVEIDMPAWAERQLERRHEQGEFVGEAA